MANHPMECKQRLLHAILTNDVDTFRIILDNEILPRDSPWSDYELLCRATKLGNHRIIQLLIQFGCRVNKADSKSSSPLHLAAGIMQNSSIVRLFLSKGAVIDKRDKDGDTAIHLAFMAEADGIVEELMQIRSQEGVMDNIMNDEGLSYLHIACTRPGMLNVVNALVEYGADINCQIHPGSVSFFGGSTPLHFAVEHGRQEVIELLLNSGANINIQNSNGSTPLHIACEKQDANLIDLLLAYDVQRENFVNSYGLSHFMVACCCSDLSIVENFLFRMQYNPQNTGTHSPIFQSIQINEMYPFSGYTPLHFASEYGRIEICKLLLDLGANCCARNNQGFIPLELAQKSIHHETCQLLRERCPRYRSSR